MSPNNQNEIRQSEITASLIAAGLLTASPAGDVSSEEGSNAVAASGDKPNILFVLVDEMRFPGVFPEGVHDAAGFLKAFMPNVYKLWKKGVKFSNYHTAASACTPARATLITGLYSQQQWICCTITSDPHKSTTPTPTLLKEFPTYGKLLREAGYQTPYIGKWHVSIPQQNEPGMGLEAFGFDGKTWPDMPGFNLQGTVGNEALGYHNDEYVSQQAQQWLSENGAGSDSASDQTNAPWCLTVSFVNPHDKEFFWAGTEFTRYNALFENQSEFQPISYYSTESGNGAPPVPWIQDELRNPPRYGYPAVPPNWESATQLAATKPSTQICTRSYSDLVWGGASDDPQSSEFAIVPYPNSRFVQKRGINWGIGTAPYSYWSRGLDCYTQTMGIVDQRIGEVLDALDKLPEDVVKNTVVVFASDHGDYAGAHGLLSGKMGTAYREAYNVPLIVMGPNKDGFTGDTHIVRDGLVSSVDLLRMFVSLGHGGGQEWLERPDLNELYGKRHDLLPMLKSAEARGRDYLLLATDEVVPGDLNYNEAPLHVLGIQTREGKFAAYSDWLPHTDEIRPISLQTELYDYGTEGGRQEVANMADNSPAILPLTRLLFDHIVPDELRAPLPEALQEAQRRARASYLRYEAEARIQKAAAAMPLAGTPFGGGF